MKSEALQEVCSRFARFDDINIPQIQLSHQTEQSGATKQYMLG